MSRVVASKTLVVFVAGLAHSGSTLLDLLMGGHGRFIGLGELRGVLASTGPEKATLRAVTCSCGSAMAVCEFWGPVLSRFEAVDHPNLTQKLAIVLDEFNRAYGGEAVIVDSSKYLPHLNWLSEIEDLDLRVLHIIRDVRSYTTSQLDNYSRKRNGYAPLRRFSLFIQWYRRNKQILQFLESKEVPYLRVGYEELALFPKLTLTRICEFLGTELRLSMLDPGASRSHSVLGNRMRHQSEKMTIAYDHRWFTRKEWMMPSVLFPRIMLFNRLNVYSNNTEQVWNR